MSDGHNTLRQFIYATAGVISGNLLEAAATVEDDDHDVNWTVYLSRDVAFALANGDDTPVWPRPSVSLIALDIYVRDDTDSTRYLVRSDDFVEQLVNIARKVQKEAPHFLDTYPELETWLKQYSETLFPTLEFNYLLTILKKFQLTI